MKVITEWSQILDAYQPDPDLVDDAFATSCCLLAIQAVRSGNIGVGAVLVDSRGAVCETGHNTIFSSGFRTDLHAEMVVMNSFEDKRRRPGGLDGCMLVTSLEPCVMCTARLIFAGVPEVRYLAEDDAGGMARARNTLPPWFVEQAKSRGQLWERARCSPLLQSAAFEIWTQSRVVESAFRVSRDATV